MIKASVIIPTYNRVESLSVCLGALSQQTQPHTDFEAIVVVDGSTDATLEMLNGFQAPYHLRVIQQTNSGQYIALNHGVNAARGRICIFLDDDIIAAPQFVSEHICLHMNHEDVVGIGKITLTLPPGADWYTHHFAGQWEKHYAALDQGKKPTWQDCFGGNMSVTRKLFLAVGGNALDLPRAYDNELAYRLMQTGCSFVYLPQAIGDQLQQKGFFELMSDSEKSGAACVELARRHPAMLSPLLGTFGEQRPFIAAQLRLLLALNISPYLLERTRRFFGKWSENENNFHVLQRYCFWREVRRTFNDRESWQALIQGVPILLYHAFGAPGEKPSRYVINVRKFERQMAWLKWMGYHILNLNEYIDYRISNLLPPPRSVVITIDDGYKDSWKLAYPVLRKYNFPATVFPVSQSIGGSNTWDNDAELSGRPMISWQNILEMQQGGIDFGAHSRTHPDLTSISNEQARKEIEGSKEDMEQGLGDPIRVFCYPFGKFNNSIQTLVEQADFQGSCSIQIGKNTLVTPLQELRRVEIRGTDSFLQFTLSVRYGLDRQNLVEQLRR